MKLEIRPGAFLWRERLNQGAQRDLLDEVMAGIASAPFYQPKMPGSGRPFSVKMTNFGSVGWISDQKGYRYEKTHPGTGWPWPQIPAALLELWEEISQYRAPPEACLVNLYRGFARMGLHQDRDEVALDAPVLSVSLGDMAHFRIGGPVRGKGSRSVVLRSGDVLMMGGQARLCYHGIDKILVESSNLVPGGGRINLTLRRVRLPEESG